MAEPTAQEYSGVVDQLYLAAQQPEHWTAAMDGVRRMFDGSRACLLLADPVSGYRSVPSVRDDEFERSGALELAVSDGLLQAWLAIRPGEPTCYREMMDLDAFRQRDLMRLHFRPRDMDNGLVCVFRSGPMTRWSLDVSRHYRQEDFTPAEKTLALRLMPHVLRALQIAAATGSAPVRSGLAGAYFVVDARGRTVDMNEAADALLARPGSPLRQLGGVLRAVSQSDTERLGALIASCCMPPDNPRSSPGGMIAAASDDAPIEQRLLVSAAPMPGQGWIVFQKQRCALLLVRPLHSGSQVAIAELAASLYGLSASHARLAAALTVGMSLRQAAATLGLSYGSARRYLEEIFRRTATRRQPELVALLKTIDATRARQVF